MPEIDEHGDLIQRDFSRGDFVLFWGEVYRVSSTNMGTAIGISPWNVPEPHLVFYIPSHKLKQHQRPWKYDRQSGSWK